MSSESLSRLRLTASVVACAIGIACAVGIACSGVGANASARDARMTSTSSSSSVSVEGPTIAGKPTSNPGKVGNPRHGSAEASETPHAEPPATEKIFFAALPLASTPGVARLARSADDDSSFAKQLRLRLHVMRGYDNLGEMTRRSKLPLVNGVFQMSDLSHLFSHDRPRKAHRQATFVVDYDERAMDGPAQALNARFSRPQPEDVAGFVSEYIVHKSYQRAFDVASRVAQSQAGDCTEHAVLTAALLRRVRYPARVILGIVLLAVDASAEEPRLMAVGHSWVEYHDGKQWQIVDAALRPEGDPLARRTGAPGVDEGRRLRLAYLPIKVIDDESAAFTRSLMDDVGVESVLRVELDVVQ